MSNDPRAAVDGAHVVATDTWVSMGDSDPDGSKAAALVPFAITRELLAAAEPDALVLHCLPAYRGKEIEADFIDGPDSAVWDEAENRRHAQKAVLTFLLDPSVISTTPTRMGFR